MNNKRITAILLAVILASSALAACSTAHPAAITDNIPEETTMAVKSTIPGEITVSGTQAATDETTLPFSDISDIKKPTTQERTTIQKPSDGTTAAPPKTTNPVTTTKPKTTTTTRPVTTTRPTTTTTKPTTTTTKPAPSTPTKAQIDEIVRDATAYGKSLGMGVNNSLTIGNSSWSGPANTQYESLGSAKETVYYQINKWAKKLKASPNWYDGAAVFKVVSKKLSDGNYEIYVLIG